MDIKKINKNRVGFSKKNKYKIEIEYAPNNQLVIHSENKNMPKIDSPGEYEVDLQHFIALERVGEEKEYSSKINVINYVDNNNISVLILPDPKFNVDKSVLDLVTTPNIIVSPLGDIQALVKKLKPDFVCLLTQFTNSNDDEKLIKSLQSELTFESTELQKKVTVKAKDLDSEEDTLTQVFML